MERLTNLYKSVLESLGCRVGDDGIIYSDNQDDALPVTVGDDTLLFPSREILRQGIGNGYVGFHPLSENVIRRKESPVHNRLRHLVVHRLNLAAAGIALEIMALAVNKDQHKKCSPTIASVFTHLPDVDKKSFNMLKDILLKIDPTGKNRIVNVYAKHGGKYRGKPQARTAVVTFPIIEELANADKTVFGVSVRKKDIVALKALFDTILLDGNGLDIEHFSYGSNSKVAPYFHALMGAYHKVASQFNNVVKIFKKHFEEDHHIDLSWYEDMDNLSEYRDLIPTLHGNAGEHLEEEIQQGAPSSAAQQQIVPHTSVANASAEETGSADGGFKPLGKPLGDLATSTSKPSGPVVPGFTPPPAQAPQQTGGDNGWLNYISQRQAEAQSSLYPKFSDSGMVQRPYMPHQYGAPMQHMNHMHGYPQPGAYGQPVGYGQQPYQAQGYPSQGYPSHGQMTYPQSGKISSI